VWGLSSYLIVDKNMGVQEVREAATQWLRFIFPNYYIIQELQARGVDPSSFGLIYESSCYSGRCELPFGADGCGGMGELKL